VKLKGRTIAVSIGGAPDLARLGYPAREVERALLSVCGALVRAGAGVAYGGDFRPGGFTLQMYRHLAGAYADQAAQPFVHYIPEPVLRRTGFTILVESLRESRGVATTLAIVSGETYSLRASGTALRISKDGIGVSLETAPDLESWLTKFEPVPDSGAYTKMREIQAANTDGRVAMGGKMEILENPQDAYEGTMPGIAEEALLTLSTGKPFVPLAAYGGATRDLAVALNLLPTTARTPRGLQAPRYDAAMAQVAAFAGGLPPSCLADLKTIAATDRIESLAEMTIGVLGRWPGTSAPGSQPKLR
jgi:hypothetical protein